MVRWWKDLSVSKKLYAVVGVLAVLIATELFTLLFAMDVLSAVRTFVHGEGLWSKGQKNAAYSLHRYAFTGDEKFFEEFKRSLEIPAGDRAARIELEKPDYDYHKVEEGFARGQVSREDVPGLVNLIRRFYWAPYISQALVVWRAADAGIDDLVAAGNDLRTAMLAGASRAEVERRLVKIDAVNERLERLEVEFSQVLGEGSRWLENLLMVILVIAVLTVESTGLFLTISFSRSLNRSLHELMDAAQEVGRGNFDQKAPVRSNDELGKLAMAINKMSVDLKTNQGLRQQAESASQYKSQFLANMSHEIRTPLSVILGLTEVLRDDRLSREEQLRYIDTIERTGGNLIRIINDILDLSKVEADHLEIECTRFSLPEFVNELQNMLSVQARKAENSLRFMAVGAPPSEVITDRTRLRQILVNLLNNSLKYTRNGIVTLTYWQDGNHLAFEISDTGRGIDEEDRAKLFAPFTRTAAENAANSEGTGLGLMLAKRLAAALGGGVELRSTQIGKGSTFRAWVRPQGMFTAVPEQVEGRFSGPQDNSCLRGRRVLVVEDSEDNQLLVKLLLTRVGVLSDFANNGQEAVEMALPGKYDFILMDMQMPVKDGYAATRELRQKGYKKPIIALTAHAMKEDRARCLEAGCSDYLTKPIDSRLLFSTLQKHAAQLGAS
ncbi:MAG: response regulator [Bdellovibrionales bacterium]|nr:response regulator [Bdellovibrionales bacterium]